MVSSSVRNLCDYSIWIEVFMTHHLLEKLQVNMVLQDYWTVEHILQRKSHLLKQQKHRDHTEAQMESNQVSNKVFTSKALRTLNYKKAYLDAFAQSCDALDEQQKAKLLTVLKQHESLFQGKQGNWKGRPVSIEVIDGTVPVCSKPYPIPLKSRETFKEEAYRQCNIGALR